MPPRIPLADPTSPEAPVARDAIKAVLAGELPTGATPRTCGAWWPLVESLMDMYATRGKESAVYLFQVFLRMHPHLVRLMQPGASPDPAARPALPAYPPLPPAAAAIAVAAAPCGAWLDDYVEFAVQAAPMTPRSFHEAAGLFLAALAVGRRLVYYHGLIPFYPNLYFLWIGPTTVYRKSTAVAIFTAVLRRAGLHDLLLSEGVTAEALLQEFSLAIPETYPHWSAPRRERWLVQRGMAAQRAVRMDEASFLFDTFGREGKGPFLSLLLRLYDCPDELSDHTIARGLNQVERAALSFFGITTPAGMAPHFRTPALWSKGLWRRFILITPDDKPVWQSQAAARAYPAPLIDGLRRLFELFPMPRAELVQSAPGVRYVAVAGIAEPSLVLLAPGVLAAWEAYSRATGHDMLLDGRIDELLHGCYGGLGAHTLKVAMLLAAMDAPALPVTVELPHYARAVAIVERWRAALHRLWDTAMITAEAHAADRILQALAAAGVDGLTVRELCQALHLRAREVREILGVLALSGKVRNNNVKAGNGRRVEIWSTIA